MRELVIRERKTGDAVHRVDVTGKSDSQIARVEMGMAINFNFDDYYWTDEQRPKEVRRASKPKK